MAATNLGFRVLHQNGILPPRAAEYNRILLSIANKVIGSARAMRLQSKLVTNSPISLQVANPKMGEKGRQSVASFIGDVIDAQFKCAVENEQKSGRLQELRIIKTASGKGPAIEKKGPDFVLDSERVAWDITSEASIAGHYERDIRGKEESWNAYIVFPY